MVLDQLFRRLRGEPEVVPPVSIQGCNVGGSVGVGGTVSASATAQNTTTDPIDVTVDFKAGGQTISSDLVSLPPAGSATASASLSWNQLSDWEGGSVSISAQFGNVGTASCGSVSVASAPDIDPPDPDPASFEVTGCEGVPGQLNEGEYFNPQGQVQNTGGEQGSVTVEFRVDGETHKSVNVTASGGQTVTAQFGPVYWSDLTAVLSPGTAQAEVVAGGSSQSCGSIEVMPGGTDPPANLRVTTCEGVPGSVSPGDSFTPQPWVANDGGQEGSATIEWQVDGQTLRTTNVTVPPGETMTAPFNPVSHSDLVAQFDEGTTVSSQLVAAGTSQECATITIQSGTGDGDLPITSCSNVRFDELMKMHADLTINNTQPDQMYEIVLYANGEFEGRHEYDNPGGDTISAEHAIPERLGEFYNRFSPGDEIEIGFSAHAGGLEGNSPGPECTSTVTWDPPEHPVRIDNFNPMGGVPPYDGPGSDIISGFRGALPGITQGILEIDLTNISGRVISGLDDTGRGIPVSIDYHGLTIPEDGMSLDPGRADTATLAHLPPLFSPFESTRIDATWQHPSAAGDGVTVSLHDSDGSVIDSITIETNNNGAKVIKPSQCMPDPHPSWPSCDGPRMSCQGDHCERECAGLDTGCPDGQVCIDHQCQPCEGNGQCSLMEECVDGRCVPFGSEPIDPENITLTGCSVTPTEVYRAEDQIGLSATYRNDSDSMARIEVKWAADGLELPAAGNRSIGPGQEVEISASIEYGSVYTVAGDKESYEIGVKSASVVPEPEGQAVATKLEDPSQCATLQVPSDPPPGGDPEPGECEVNTDCPEGEICINGTCFPENTGPPGGGDGDGDNDWLWIAGGIAAAGAGAAAYLRQRNGGSSRSNGSSRSRR